MTTKDIFLQIYNAYTSRTYNIKFKIPANNEYRYINASFKIAENTVPNQQQYDYEIKDEIFKGSFAENTNSVMQFPNGIQIIQSKTQYPNNNDTITETIYSSFADPSGSGPSGSLSSGPSGSSSDPSGSSSSGPSGSSSDPSGPSGSGSSSSSSDPSNDMETDESPTGSKLKILLENQLTLSPEKIDFKNLSTQFLQFYTETRNLILKIRSDTIKIPQSYDENLDDDIDTAGLTKDEQNFKLLLKALEMDRIEFQSTIQELIIKNAPLSNLVNLTSEQRAKHLQKLKLTQVTKIYNLIQSGTSSIQQKIQKLINIVIKMENLQSAVESGTTIIYMYNPITGTSRLISIDIKTDKSTLKQIKNYEKQKKQSVATNINEILTPNLI